jgi:cytoskeletal protein RodZ
LREIADVTKISIRYLEALEGDRFDILPAPVFARGFLREYARYVGLDPDEVVNSYISAQQPTEPEEEPEGPLRRRSSRSRRSSTVVLIVSVLVVLGVVAGIAYYIEMQKGDLERGTQSISEPSIETPPQAVASRKTEQGNGSEVAASAHLVAIDFSGDCWIEVVVDSGRRISELHVAGESLQVEAKERVILTVDNPDVVQIEVNGTRFPIESDPSTIPSVIEIDLTATLAEGQ